MITRNKQGSVSAVHIIFGVIALIVLSSGIFYINKNTTSNTSSLNEAIYTASSTPQLTEFILTKRGRLDFQSLVTAISQENSFESSMMYDNAVSTSSIPKITSINIVKIEDILETLPYDDKKTFCSKLPTYSESLSKRIDDTRIKIGDLFEKRMKAISEEKISRAVKIERNRNLRDGQIETYFSRLKSSVATSSADVQLINLQTGIQNIVRDSRNRADQSVDSVHLGFTDSMNKYKDDVFSALSNFETSITKVLSTAKKDCSDGVYPRAVRVSLHAGLTVLKKNLFDEFQYLQYPYDEVNKLIETRNDSRQVLDSERSVLLNELERIQETIPKK
jgi:uncharacterized protein (UPF0333 family)